jgi:hypothetical protein
MPLYGKKTFTAMSLLLAVVIANASPMETTVSDVAFTLQQSIDISAVTACYNEDIKSICPDLADIGHKLRTPPAFFTESDETVLAESLPAVPKALLMALTGFICVSLIKDRKLWLTVLCGLIWASQTGIQVLPQLAERFNIANHSKLRNYANPSYISYLENSLRRRCDIEGTQYIGLLHHLAGIPNTDPDFINILQNKLTVSNRKGLGPFCKVFRRNRKNAYLSLFANLPEQYQFNLTSKCLVLKTEQPFISLPAFNLIPRGPPQSDSMSSHTVGV